MLSTGKLAFKFLWRELKAGEWYIILLSLILCIAALTSLDFYIDRLMRGIDRQSAQLLGGDLVISSSSPIDVTWEEKAKSLKMKMAKVLAYPSVINAHDNMQLVNIQAVSDTYPIFSQANFPQSGTAWVDARLLSNLFLKLNDEIKIGASYFKVTKTLASENEILNTGWAIAPYVMIALNDVAATKTVVAGSRVDYRLLLGGDSQQINLFKQWVLPKLKIGQRLLDIHDQQFVLRSTLNRISQYLQIVLLSCLTMSGVAIAMSTQQYLKRHYEYIALWRCLGISSNRITAIFIWQLSFVAFFASLIAVSIGFISQAFIANLFQAWLRIPLPSVSLYPIWMGFITCIFLLYAFTYPLVTQLPNISPLYLWRREINLNKSYSLAYFISALIILLAIVMLRMNFSLLAILYMDILLVTGGLLYAFNQIILRHLRRLLNYVNGSIKQGLSQLVHYPQLVSLQFVGFTFIIMSMIALYTLKNNLIQDWQQSLPNNTPNYFAFNIPDQDLDNVKHFFNQHQVNISGIYPMVRARLTALNQQPIMQAVPAEARSHNALHRELNLSWMFTYPADNKIVSGFPWSEQDRAKALISIEQNLAQALGIKLGDELSFQGGDQSFSARVSNIRSLEWTSFHPNFFIIFPPGFIQSNATTYITSFYLSNANKPLLNELSAQFPSITIIDVANVLTQIQTIISHISSAMQYLFIFILAIAMLIFIASLEASMDERKQTYRLLRILGASRHYIIKSISLEFIILASMIGLASILLGKGIAFIITHFIFTL